MRTKGLCASCQADYSHCSPAGTAGFYSRARRGQRLGRTAMCRTPRSVWRSQHTMRAEHLWAASWHAHKPSSCEDMLTVQQALLSRHTASMAHALQISGMVSGNIHANLQLRSSSASMTCTSRRMHAKPLRCHWLVYTYTRVQEPAWLIVSSICMYRSASSPSLRLPRPPPR